MNEPAILFSLSLCSIVLMCIVIYQQIAFHTGTQAELCSIARGLKQVLDSNDAGPILVFTDNKTVMELVSQINRLLDDRQNRKVEFIRSQMAAKRMLSNISHDLKTPMTVILGYLEILRLKEGKELPLLEKVEAKAHDVMELIQQFFTLAKLEAGDTSLELTSVPVNEVCRENVLDFYELLTRKQFEVELRIPETPIYAHANREALKRILSNLISNAIRYGSAGKYLGVFLRADQAAVYIDIVDKGRGIQKEFADRIFDRLFTMDDARCSQTQGNGLGLTIARNLAWQLGGDITLESRPFQKTTFTVRLTRIPYVAQTILEERNS